MNLPTDGRPRVLNVPPFTSTSLGRDAVELCESVGLHLDPWQQLALIVTLAETQTGTAAPKWAAGEVGLLAARQNGKGEWLLARELVGLFLLGERLIMHTAHEFKTTAEAFLRLKSIIDGSDDLRRQVKNIRTSHGEESVELKTGQRCRFAARSKSSGRGFTVDALLLDEAQELSRLAVAAMLFTISARPNPQVIYTGTVPGPANVNCEQWTSVRDRGRAGGPGLAWLEWSAPGSETGLVDLDDETGWDFANPAKDIRLATERIRGERRALVADDFARERLSVWPDGDAAIGIFGAGQWEDLADPNSSITGGVTFGVEVADDRSWSAIAAAGIGPYGIHVEVIDYRKGTDWVVQQVTGLLERHDGSQVAARPGSPAGSLIPLFPERSTVKVNQTEFGAAYGAMYDAVVSCSLRHLAQPELDACVSGARPRSLGDAKRWDARSSTLDISPLQAVTLALGVHVARPAFDILGAIH
jgi:hypothetical protein